MIVTRTPLRVSFAGGGTDLASFYRQYGGGAVTSAAIDKYVHVLVNTKFDKSVRVAYSRTENVERVEELQHGIVRAALHATGVKEAVEIHTIADIPGEGTGLGSSSSLTVGLLNALYAYRGGPTSLRDAGELAEEACRIEIDELKGSSGKQDQYIAAFGGVQYFEFKPDDTVRVVPIPLTTKARERLGEHLSLFYTGVTRRADGLLAAQSSRSKENHVALERMRDLAKETRDALVAERFGDVGRLMDEGWRLKRELADGISNPTLDQAYSKARAAGALGGKITGAGGGGFLLIAHPPGQAGEVEAALAPMRRFPVRIVPEGSSVIWVRR